MPSSWSQYRRPLLYVSFLVALLAITDRRSPFCLFIPTGNVPDHPTVTGQRTGISYVGTTADGIEHFQNIFYAEDTGGPNRFALPVPLKLSPGSVVDATAEGAACPQAMGDAPLPFTSGIYNVSENCLSLRIVRPAAIGASAKLPVVVWIHGGGSILGSAYDQLYEGDGLVMQSVANRQPIIFVGMNYRLGIFGFAMSKALRKAKQTNVGLRDQRAAFEWLRDNIAAFGGDPDNITAMGQSVGASAIGLHLVSYRGDRGVPFHKAIMMSGGTGLNFNIKSDLVANNTAAVAKDIGCIDEHPDSSETLACLRTAPLDKLMNASVSLARATRPPFGELSFYPSFDGDYILDRPSILLRKGQVVKDIPIIASWVANDGAWYAPPSITDDAAVIDTFSTFIIGFSKPTLQALLALYPLSDFTPHVSPHDVATAQHYRAARMVRDLFFACPVLDFTWQYAQRHGGGRSNVRLYQLNQTRFGPVYERMGIPHWKVSHLSDIPYMLNGNVAGGGDNGLAQRELAARMSGSLAAFAYSGDPNESRGKVLADWPEAFGGLGVEDLGEEGPEKLTIYVAGGVYGSGPASVSVAGESELGGREAAMSEEKLLRRCRFVSSIAEEIGV